MRYYIIILMSYLLFSCQTEKVNTKPNWLIGKWIRTNESSDKNTFEFWDNQLNGIGFTLKKSDTIFKEQMYFQNINDTLHLTVSGVNEIPTLFKITHQTDSSFICENNKNEFPKKIHYFKDQKQLKCIVSNNDFSIDFIFDKIKP